MKRVFEAPTVEIIRLADADIIVTSDENEGEEVDAS